MVDRGRSVIHKNKVKHDRESNSIHMCIKFEIERSRGPISTRKTASVCQRQLPSKNGGERQGENVMSKIEQLIKKLCPKGVERVPLSHAVKIKRGVRVVKQQLKDVGQYPVFQNCLTSMGFYDQANCPAGTAFVIAAGAAGSVGYSDVDFWAADDCYYMVTPENVNGKYLYYALKSKEHLLFAKVRKASVPRLAREVVESVEIAFPPRPVQDEIVKALDAMDAVVKALEEERKARFEQFEAMRDKLLKFANGGGIM